VCCVLPRETTAVDLADLGDRAWALRDQRNGRIVSAKRVPRLLEFRATYEVEPTPESAGAVRIKTPDGDTPLRRTGRCFGTYFGNYRPPGGSR
jgi:uncharacterized protein YcbX